MPHPQVVTPLLAAIFHQLDETALKPHSAADEASARWCQGGDQAAAGHWAHRGLIVGRPALASTQEHGTTRGRRALPPPAMNQQARIWASPRTRKDTRSRDRDVAVRVHSCSMSAPVAPEGGTRCRQHQATGRPRLRRNCWDSAVAGGPSTSRLSRQGGPGSQARGVSDSYSWPHSERRRRLMPSSH